MNRPKEQEFKEKGNNTRKISLASMWQKFGHENDLKTQTPLLQGQNTKQVWF